MKLEIITLPAMRLAYMRHTGPYGNPGIAQTWARFGDWCGEHGLMEPRRKMYGISHDNPATTPPNQCRYDCCVAVGKGFKPQDGIEVQDFAGGPYASARFTGTALEIPLAWMRLFGEWLPQSGYQPTYKAALEIYEEDFSVNPATGVFSCLVCAPVLTV